MQVAREEIEHLRAYVNLDTSFEAQVNTTDDAQLNSAVQETINTVAALAKKLLTLRGQLSSQLSDQKTFPNVGEEDFLISTSRATILTGCCPLY